MSTDLALLAADQADIEASGDPGAFVMLACERAKAWLTQALAREPEDITQMVELRSNARLVQELSARKQLGHEAELAAAEIVRRAERSIGLAIRQGQQAGWIRKPGDPPPLARQPYERVLPDGRRQVVRPSPRGASTDDRRTSPSEFLQPNQEMVDTYAVTDGVTDEQFDSAISEAKAEGNLSRNNVVHKVRGEAPAPAVETSRRIAELAARGQSSRQIADELALNAEYVRRLARAHNVAIPADRTIGKAHRHDSNRIVGETIHALEGLRMGLDLVNFAELDQTQLPDWSSSLKESLRSLNRLSKELNQ